MILVHVCAFELDLHARLHFEMINESETRTAAGGEIEQEEDLFDGVGVSYPK